MEGLLKTNFKSHFESSRQLKRQENVQRCKNARGLSVQDKRNIPNNLDLSNDSLNITTRQTKTKSTKTAKPNDRKALLQEWKKAKERQKENSRTKRSTFVVKHIVYNDYIYVGKENIVAKNNVSKSKHLENNIPSKRQPSKILKERNILHENNVISKSQILKKTKDNVLQKNRPVTRSCKNKTKTLNRIVEKTQIESKSDKLKVDKLPFKTVKNEIDNQKKEEKLEAVQNSTESVVEGPTLFEFSDSLTFTNFKFDLQAFSPSLFNKKCSPKNCDDITICQLTFCNDEDSQKIARRSVEVKQKILGCSKSTSKIESLRRSARLYANKTPNSLNETESLGTKNTPKTPVSLFKERVGIVHRTPVSIKYTKRTSLTPNPKNFLSKVEDPVAQRIEQPKVGGCTAPNTPPDVSESVKHFTKLVAVEEEKFHISIENWNKVLEKKLAPENVQGDILAAIGQAQLFIRKRFKQFKGLIDLHKDKSAEKGANTSDLDGFWEMIYYQVTDVHKRFAELETLQINNWEKVKIEPVKVVKKIKKATVKKTQAANPNKGAATRMDFKKFRQQMKANKEAEVLQQLDAAIMVPAVQNDNNKTITLVRRSLRHLKNTPKNGLSMTLPIEPVVDAVLKLASSSVCDEYSAGSLEENSPDKPAHSKKEASKQINQIDVKENILKPLRRSTRKTPSKCRNTDDIANRIPEDIACNLFVDDDVDNSEDTNKNLVGTTEGVKFSKYLSKTILLEDQPVKRDLLSSFDEPDAAPPTINRPLDDLMVFSPLAPTASVKHLRKLSENKVPALMDDLLS